MGRGQMALQSAAIGPKLRKPNETRIEWVDRDVVCDAAVFRPGSGNKLTEAWQNVGNTLGWKSQAADYRYRGFHKAIFENPSAYP